MRSLIVALLLMTVALAQSAVNFSGKWTIQTGAARGGGGGGRGGQTLTLNQTGTVVTGELVGGGGGGGGSAAPINNEIYGGKVEGNRVSFYVWRGTDKPYKMEYAGTMNAAGDEIVLTVTGGAARGGGGGGAGQGRGQGAAAPTAGAPANPAPAAAAPAAPAAPPPTIARRVK